MTGFKVFRDDGNLDNFPNEITTVSEESNPTLTSITDTSFLAADIGLTFRYEVIVYTTNTYVSTTSNVLYVTLA